MWRWGIKSRYTRFLEGEVERLRAEIDRARKQNWALVNSLVTTAGAPLPQEILRGAEARGEAAASRQDAGATKPVVRKRSWQQIARAIEAKERAEMRERIAGGASVAPLSPFATERGAASPDGGQANGKGQA